MPFVGLSEPVPSVPVVICRDGYYWSGSRTRRRQGFPCATVEVRSLTVDQVAATYEGEAQQRAAALAALTDGQRVALYPSRCPECEQNHAINVANLLRAWSAIHPAAREACARLPTQAYIAVAAVRGDTPEETARLQVLEAARRHFQRAG
jgi:hypothetical protein